MFRRLMQFLFGKERILFLENTQSTLRSTRIKNFRVKE
jgi:hypothetical protein